MQRVIATVIVGLAAAAALAAQAPSVGLPAESAGLDQIVRTLIASFDRADILALGEAHATQPDSDLRIALVRHPDFAKRVGSIVAVAVEHVRSVLPAFVDNFRVGNLFDVTHWEKDPPYRLALLMVGRLFEVSQARRNSLIEGLRRSSLTVLLYRYPGTWSEEFRATVEKAGFGNVIALAGQCALVTLD